MENIDNENIDNEKVIQIIGTGQRYQMKKVLKLPKLILPLKPVMEMKKNNTDDSFFSKYNLLENQRELLETYRNLPPIKSHFIDRQIRKKLSSYKQQDMLKNRYDNEHFVDIDSILQMMKECQLKCHYCSDITYLLYEFVREKKQWTLDRIDNDIGHISTNIVIACLECNLKRRRIRKDAFQFTKNLDLRKI
jgi:hypothetical protein